MSDNFGSIESTIDTMIVALERQIEVQRAEMRRELDELMKANRALSTENEELRAGVATPVTLICSVVPIGLVDTMLPPTNAFAETVATMLIDKRKCVECLRQADNNYSHDADSWDHHRHCLVVRKQLFSHNPALQVLSDIASSSFTMTILSQEPPQASPCQSFKCSTSRETRLIT